jgi:DNA-binding response OmpR family regulator
MMTQKHILIVDDNRSARLALATLLAEEAGLLVLHAGSSTEATAMVLAGDPRIDAALVESSLRDAPGSEFCLRLRRFGVRIPLILLGERPGEPEVVRGLDAGANDFIGRPYRVDELRARVRAQLRVHEVSEDAVLQVGPYQFRPAARLLQDAAANRRIRLTEKEAAVLKFLYRAAGRPVTRKTLLHEVWGYSPGASTHTVETHIYRLRRKMEPDPTQITLLINEDGGYRLDPEWRAASRFPWQPDRQPAFLAATSLGAS